MPWACPGRLARSGKSPCSALLGTLVNVVLKVTVAFAVLPGSGAETFAAFGLCLVPIGALLAQAVGPAKRNNAFCSARAAARRPSHLLSEVAQFLPVVVTDHRL
jgi:hypothetical protein